MWLDQNVSNNHLSQICYKNPSGQLSKLFTYIIYMTYIYYLMKSYKILQQKCSDPQ